MLGTQCKKLLPVSLSCFCPDVTDAKGSIGASTFAGSGGGDSFIPDGKFNRRLNTVSSGCKKKKNQLKLMNEN